MACSIFQTDGTDGKSGGPQEGKGSSTLDLVFCDVGEDLSLRSAKFVAAGCNSNNSNWDASTTHLSGLILVRWNTRHKETCFNLCRSDLWWFVRDDQLAFHEHKQMEKQINTCLRQDYLSWNSITLVITDHRLGLGIKFKYVQMKAD